MSVQYNNENITELAQQYLSKLFNKVHEAWDQFFLSIFENPSAIILDLDVGSGRDPEHFANLSVKTHVTQNNIQIFSSELYPELSVIGQKTTQSLYVKWMEDSFPALSNVTKQVISDTVIQLNTVWMNIPQSDLARSTFYLPMRNSNMEFMKPDCGHNLTYNSA